MIIIDIYQLGKELMVNLQTELMVNESKAILYRKTIAHKIS